MFYNLSEHSQSSARIAGDLHPDHRTSSHRTVRYNVSYWPMLIVTMFLLQDAEHYFEASMYPNIPPPHTHTRQHGSPANATTTKQTEQPFVRDPAVCLLVGLASGHTCYVCQRADPFIVLRNRNHLLAIDLSWWHFLNMLLWSVVLIQAAGI